MSIEYRRFNHITIAVPAGEHDKVRAFYGGVLGLKEVEPPDSLSKLYDLIWYDWLDILLHLDFTPPWTRPAQNRHVAVEIKHIHRVRAYLEQQGVEILEGVAVPDRERFYLLDPFGNYFEFIELNNS
jgi:catechol 2,3-dioxygenase-like lactoylglutathione lyase family enzyme